MPRKKSPLKGGLPGVRIRSNSRLMHTHESVVDCISGRMGVGSLIDVLGPTFFDFHCSRKLEEDLIYSDDDDDEEYEDIDDDDSEHLEPHPKIKQLSDEEADKLGIKVEKEEGKGKTERNKRKKMRKKEKKRQEKENAVKDNLLKEEQAMSASIDIHQENTTIKSNAKANEFPEDNKAQNATEVAGGDDSEGNTEQKKALKVKKKEDKEQEGSNLKKQSYAFIAKSEPKETCNQKPKEEAKEKSKTGEFPQPEEEKKIEQPADEAKLLDLSISLNTIEKEKQDLREMELAKEGRNFAGLAYHFASQGDFENAVVYFTESIKYNPTELKLFGNRSLCYERMRQYENALQDAEVALSMDPTWIKGLFRKGKALCGLKRYYEATFIYKEVLKLDRASVEAAQELKRAQTLHLMEMGFSWAQSSEALKKHGTLEDAVEALFGGSKGASKDGGAAGVLVESRDDEDGWVVLQTSRPRAQQIRVLNPSLERRSNSQSPTQGFKSPVKREVFPVWVENIWDDMTYADLHKHFSSVGTVVSIKMFLEAGAAIVNYLKKEDRYRAVERLDQELIDDARCLTVRFPNPRDWARKKECFFWRTTGCTRPDCTFIHLPQNKNIDRDKMTYGFGNAGLGK